MGHAGSSQIHGNKMTVGIPHLGFGKPARSRNNVRVRHDPGFRIQKLSQGATSTTHFQRPIERHFITHKKIIEAKA